MTESDTRSRAAAVRRAAPALALLAALMGCSLNVDDLPENKLPVVGAISMAPPPEQLAPLDSFRLSVDAVDPDGDPLSYLWSSGNVGEWAAGAAQGDTAVWVAPPSLADVDTVHFSVRVYDFDVNRAVERTLDVPYEVRTGSLRVLVRDLAGQEAAVRIAVLDQDTTDAAASEALFTELPEGNHDALTLGDAVWHGAEAGLFAGYPKTVRVRAGQIETLVLRVAPRSMLLVPGVADGAPVTDVQAGIDWCRDQGVDTLLLRTGDLTPLGVSVGTGGEPVGTAALDLSGVDLTLMPFPDEGPLWIDAGYHACTFGLFLAGNGPATRVRGLGVRGASASGAYLYHASASLDTLRLEDCGSAGIFLDGEAGDTLRLADVELAGNEHGLSASGGFVAAERVLVDASLWYGVWLREGAGASLANLTVVGSEVAAIYTAGAGTVAIARCLFAHGGRGVFDQDGSTVPALACNLFWENPFGHYGNVTPGAEDVAVDPLFCDPAGADWRVDATSPALTAACGPIGALGDCQSDPSPFAEDP